MRFLLKPELLWVDMVHTQTNSFKEVYSIELQMELAEKASIRFKDVNYIKILQGDSGRLQLQILKEVDKPVILWLDAHYSGGLTARGEKECPIYEELSAILHKMTEKKHILLIDDARCFDGTGDYPTIEQMTKYIREKQPDYRVSVKNDVIIYES